MYDIRAVVTDLDGTVLDEHEYVSPATERAAADLVARRIPLIVATARNPAWVARFHTRIPSVRIAVCCGGAVGWAAAGGELLWRDVIPPEVVEQVVRSMVHHLPEVGIATYDAERWRVTEVFVRHGPTRRGVTELVAAGRLGDGEVCAMSICWPGERHGELCAVLAELDLPLTMETSQAGVMDLVSSGTDKGGGVLRALDLVGVGPAHAVAFGDMRNDLPMFAVCGHSVAVANADPEVIAAATWIAQCVHGDGFARKLHDLGLTMGEAIATTAPTCACSPDTTLLTR